MGNGNQKIVRVELFGVGNVFVADGAGADAPGRSTGKNNTGNNFPRKLPEMITSTGAKSLVESEHQCW